MCFYWIRLTQHFSGDTDTFRPRMLLKKCKVQIMGLTVLADPVGFYITPVVFTIADKTVRGR